MTFFCKLFGASAPPCRSAYQLMYAPASTWPVWVVVLFQTVQLGLDLARPQHAEDTCPAPIVDCGDACQVFTVEARQSFAARVAQDVTKKLVAEGIHRAGSHGEGPEGRRWRRSGAHREQEEVIEAETVVSSAGWYSVLLIAEPIVSAGLTWLAAVRAIRQEGCREDGAQAKAVAGFTGPRRRGSGVLC